nr:copia protein [Tanacetum cinerariifolium]
KVILSPSSSAQSKEQDDKIMKEAKGKNPVESVIGYRDLNAEFQDCAENSSNEIPTVYKNKKDEREIVIRNKAILVAQGHTQEEGINYEEVFAPVARIKAIRLFLAYASFMGFMVFQWMSRVHFYMKLLRKKSSTPIDTEKPLLKDPDGEDVDVHTYSKEDL